MANGQIKNKRPLSVERGAGIIVCLFLLWLLAKCALPFLLPNPVDHSVAHADSPDRKWTATVSERMYASTFSGAEFVVKLSGKSSEEIFIIEADQHEPLGIEWRSPKELVISIIRKKNPVPVTDVVSLQLEEYEGIKISYEIH